jgi:hypothetical protein
MQTKLGTRHYVAGVHIRVVCGLDHVTSGAPEIR